MNLKRAIFLTSVASIIAAVSVPTQAGYRKRFRYNTTNTAPVIGGTPPTSVQAASPYAFRPTATDAQNNALTFSIANKPAWASFSSSTGALSGTPATTQTGTYSNVTIKVSDGYLTSALPVFSITVTAPPVPQQANSAPTISGAPATSVTTGSTYSFTPRASDPDGNMLAFSVSGKPAWAVFSTATGALSGAPSSTQTGTYSGITISASDGMATAALPSFAITVTAPVAVTGSAALTWSPPSQNIDGSPLTDLAGFKVYHGNSATALTDVVQLQGSASTAYTYQQLAAGTHYFAVSAYTSTGAESTLSALLSKTIQ